MDKYRGEFDELESLVSELGYSGQWEDDNGKKIFRSEDKAILNWWPKTGTLQAQGPATPKARLEEAVTNALCDETQVLDDDSGQGLRYPSATSRYLPVLLQVLVTRFLRGFLWCTATMTLPGSSLSWFFTDWI